MRNGETLQLLVGEDWAGVRASPRGDDDTAQLTRLADESVRGRVSATPVSTVGATGNPTVATTPPAVGAIGATEGGIIGRPPEGVPCVRS